MAKTHYGYKDGQFKQGKCDVTVGTCPYGNHSEDPNKINDLREYVSKSLSENPSYEAVYNLMSRMHGEKNVTSALLIQQGVPAKLAKRGLMNLFPRNMSVTMLLIALRLNRSPL